jgi:hypothetical protein
LLQGSEGVNAIWHRREGRRIRHPPYCCLPDVGAGPYVDQLFPVLAPLLQQKVPYVVICHSMGTWLAYELLKMFVLKGIPLPEQAGGPNGNSLGGAVGFG